MAYGDLEELIISLMKIKSELEIGSLMPQA